MNLNEATQFLQALARHYAGKITVTRTTTAAWATDLADLSTDDANTAWAAHRTDPDRGRYVPTAADIRAAHGRLTPTTSSPRPELGPPRIELPPERMAPDIAHAELAKAREILGPTRYSHPGFSPARLPKRTARRA